MSELALASVFAVFIWWFSTGLVLLLDRLPHGALRWGHWLSSLLALAAFVALAHTAGEATVANAYCAFTCALLVWGWHELSFLSGWVTGPRKTALPTGLSGWPRFVESVRAILWHELAIIAVGLAVVTVTWGQPNQVGTQTFLVLWVMRTSAKLNLFLGCATSARNSCRRTWPTCRAFPPPRDECVAAVFGARRKCRSDLAGDGCRRPRHAGGRGGGHRAGGHDAGPGHRRTPAAGAAVPFHGAVALGAARRYCRCHAAACSGGTREPGTP